MMVELVWFIIGVVITGGGLFIAASFTGVQLHFKEALIASVVASMVSLIPTVGFLLSVIALFYLLKRLTGAPLYPDILLMVIVSKLFILIISLTLADVINQFIG